MVIIIVYFHFVALWLCDFNVNVYDCQELNYTFSRSHISRAERC